MSQVKAIHKMKINMIFRTSILFFMITAIDCNSQSKNDIEAIIGAEEHSRLMNLTLDDFDQSEVGFRQFYDNYELICQLIPEYIAVNKFSAAESRNLHWHLGQMHAFIDNSVKQLKRNESIL